MKRRRFLGYLAATALAGPGVASAPRVDQAGAGPLKLRVLPDERIHDRIYPPPPIAELVDRIPHDWLTAFADLESWDISCEGITSPVVRRCTYRRLFHQSHVEISWSSAKDGKIMMIPPRPLRLPQTWDAIDFWVGGDPLDFERAPLVECTLNCIDAEEKEQPIEVNGKGGRRHPFAIDIFHRLVPKGIRAKLQGGSLRSIEFRLAKSEKPYLFQLYALSFYSYRGRRTYQRPVRLPFPTHPDGVVPTPAAAGTPAVEKEKGPNSSTRFSFKAADGSRVVYAYQPKTGSLDDLTVSVDDENPFRPCVGGGLVFESASTKLTPPYQPGDSTLLHQELRSGRLTAKWEARVGTQTIRYSLALRIVNRSLIVEAEVEGPSAAEFRIGYPDYPGNKRPVEVPMLAWQLWRASSANDYDPPDVTQRKGGRGRSPAILLAGDTFLSAIFDWYASDASFVYSTPEEKGAPAGFDGGAYYLPVFDGERNPLREKLILTASKEFHEVLPNIPNPPSPYGEAMRGRVYTHGEIPGISVKRHNHLGIHYVATLVQSSHAYCDYGACRASADVGDLDSWVDAPSRLRGGLEAAIRRAEEYRRIGWLIGTYSNYMILSPMFRPYAELPITHDANGFYRSSWVGTVIPATGDAIAYARQQAPKVKKTCGFQLVYADQYSIFPVFAAVDYTPDAPGAGKFRETYEQIAQLYLALKETYLGPTLSEGGLHWMYAGLIDGNLARTQHKSSWWDGPAPPDLVDFQLLKIHLLNVDVGGNDYFEQWDPELRNKSVCETLAYGKLGYWVPYTQSGQETQALSCRTYYSLHHAGMRYRCVPVEKILYHNGKEMVTASALLKTGQEGTGRLYVRYQNGFESWTNLNSKEPWRVRIDGQDWLLPPYGWFQRRKEAWGEFRSYSVIQEGEGRRLYVEDDGVLFAGAPGTIVHWLDLETDGTVIVRREETGGAQVINIDAQVLRVRASKLGLKSEANQAVLHTFDLEGNPVKDSTIAITDGWVDFSFLAQEQFALVLP